MAIFHQAENIIMERFILIIILITFFLGCVIDIQKKFKKKRREHASLKADKQLNAFLRSF